jgi:hypothetical protein
MAVGGRGPFMQCADRYENRKTSANDPRVDLSQHGSVLRTASLVTLEIPCGNHVLRIDDHPNLTSIARSIDKSICRPDISFAVGNSLLRSGVAELPK